MVTDREIELKLLNEYDSEITCRKGTSENIEYSFKNSNNKIKIAVFIHTDEHIACVWDVSWHQKLGGTTKFVSINNEKWDDILPDRELIRAIYKTFRTSKGTKTEKVLVLSTEMLNQIYLTLYDYLIPDSTDEEYDNSIEKDLDKIDIPCNRTYSTVSRINRDTLFRRNVLKKYDSTCVVCRCNVKEILQAAHIKAVKDGGDDSVENGICLCANHHLMFDNDLISISDDKSKLTKVDDSVKNMSWYNEFKEKYNEELYVPK